MAGGGLASDFVRREFSAVLEEQHKSQTTKDESAAAPSGTIQDLPPERWNTRS